MKDKFRKLEQELMKEDNIQTILHAIKKEKPQAAAEFVDSLEENLLAKMADQTAPQSTNWFDTFTNLFKKRTFAFASALVAIIFLTYILFPFQSDFAPRAFLAQASAHYDQQLTIMQKGGHIYHNVIQIQNGPDMKDYVVETSYGGYENIPESFEITLPYMEEGTNKTITESWRSADGNYLVFNRYADTDQLFGGYMILDGVEYVNNEFMNFLDVWEDDPEAQKAFQESLFTCFDEDGDSVNFSPDDLEYLEEEGEITIEGEQIIDIEGIEFQGVDPESEEAQYYKDFGALYSSDNNRKKVMETLAERDNVFYDGEFDIDGVKHHVYKFEQPLPEEYEFEMESLTWMYFSEDFELTRQDVGMRVDNKEYKISSLYFLEEEYIDDDSVFDPEKHGMTEAIKEPGCYYLFSGEQTSLSEIKGRP